MAKTLADKMKALPKSRRTSIERRASELIAEEMTLSDLRKALHKTQVDLSEALHVKQESISKLEHRSDMLISTLTKYIASMGGSLTITAEFPNRPPVVIHGFKDIEAH